MQSERIRIIVGSKKRTFEIPVEFLVGCSPVFKAMCYSRFSETTERLIQFPEVDVDMFAEFFLWVHSYNPILRSDVDTDIIIDLGIFCEMYQVHRLLNQASDALQEILRRSSTAITPEIVTKIYENTPDGSILQDLFSLRFAMTFEPSRTGFEFRHRDNYQ